MKKLVKVAALALAVVALLSVASTAQAQRAQLTLNSSALIRGGETHTYRVIMVAGQNAVVTATGDGDTDLDLYVYDEAGNLVSKDDDLTDRCVCTWKVFRTQTYTVRLVNRGRIGNLYRIRSN